MAKPADHAVGTVGRARLRSALLLLGCALLATLAAPSCAVGRHGLVAGRVTHTPSATVVDVFTLGGWVRTQDFDTGLSLGYHSTSFVFPGVEGQTPSQEWRFFSIPLPDGVPYCQASTRVGTSIDLANPQTGFNLGFLRELWRIGPGFGESVEVRFHFDRANPEATLLEVRRGL